MLSDHDYKKAIYAQDACNLSVVVHAWSEVMDKIWKDARSKDEGTAWVNAHPINILYASKVAQLTGCEVLDHFRQAYDVCLLRSGEDCVGKDL